MAGTYLPITTPLPNGAVSIQSADTTSYSQILNSMGSWVYLIKEVYIKSNNLSQLLQPLFFNQYDVNGTLNAFNQINAVDPYQYQNSLNFRLAKQNVILNGRTSIATVIEPNETVFLILRTLALENANYLPPSNFFTEDIFENYAKQI